MFRIPKRPVDSKEDPLTRDRFWKWFLDLQDLCNHPEINTKNAEHLELEIRALISSFHEFRQQKPGREDEAATDEIWVPTFHLILGACLHLAERHDEAIDELKYAASNSENLHHVEELVITCLRVGRFDDAAEAVNRVTESWLKSERDSTSRKFVKWALQYPEFLERVHAEKWKTCLRLIAAYADSPYSKKEINWK
jgi:hypothetical protein